MSTTSCIPGSPTVDCQTPSPVERVDPVGRRIYIHEDSLSALAARSEQAANLVFRMAARNVALKFVHHIEQDAALFKMTYLQMAQGLVATLNSMWSENTTNSLRMIGYRKSDPRLRNDIHPVLGQNEQIAATCYFSNYFTFATGDKMAELMFADTNDIASLKRIMQEREGYSDLTLINGINLVFLDSPVGVGAGKARAYFSRPSTMTRSNLLEIKSSIYEETKKNLRQAIVPGDNSAEPANQLWEQVLRSLNNAFRYSILKLPETQPTQEEFQP